MLSTAQAVIIGSRFFRPSLSLYGLHFLLGRTINPSVSFHYHHFSRIPSKSSRVQSSFSKIRPAGFGLAKKFLSPDSPICAWSRAAPFNAGSIQKRKGLAYPSETREIIPFPYKKRG